ncbi:MAG: hypothetical protein GX684_06000 [Ruminococcaceae bacterium]|nr:hypothetical protein [Oscillospiraceae bacterium]
MPDLSYTEIKQKSSLSPEEAVESICFEYWRFADIGNSIKENIRAYVAENLEDGKFVREWSQKLGIMVWDAWRVEE